MKKVKMQIDKHRFVIVEIEDEKVAVIEELNREVWRMAIVLVIALVCGFLAYFTGGFTSDFKTFYVTVDGKEVLTTAEGY